MSIQIDNPQPFPGQIIPDATPTRTGLMTAPQAAKLAALTPGGVGPIGPPGPPGPSGILQTAFTEVTVDTSVSAPILITPLFSVTLNTTGGRLAIHFDVSCSRTTGPGTVTSSFQLRIDLVAVRSTAVNLSVPPPLGSTALTYRTGILPAGSHVVTIFWNANGGTMNIRPVTNPIAEHASLLVEEVGP